MHWRAPWKQVWICVLVNAATYSPHIHVCTRNKCFFFKRTQTCKSRIYKQNVHKVANATLRALDLMVQHFVLFYFMLYCIYIWIYQLCTVSNLKAGIQCSLCTWTLHVWPDLVKRARCDCTHTRTTHGLSCRKRAHIYGHIWKREIASANAYSNLFVDWGPVLTMQLITAVLIVVRYAFVCICMSTTL